MVLDYMISIYILHDTSFTQELLFRSRDHIILHHSVFPNHKQISIKMADLVAPSDANISGLD